MTAREQRVPRCPVHGIAKERVYTHDIPAWICPRCQRWSA